MATLTNPAEIARETLKQMMARRMAPSPDNYRAIYNEIAGIPDKPGEPLAEREFRALLFLLPKDTPAQQRLARQLDQASKEENWEDYRATLAEFIREHSSETDLAWGELIAEMLRQWEAKQSGLTPARKRESLDRVLASGGKNSELLFSRLQNLMRAWSSSEPGQDDIVLATATQEAASPAPAPLTTGAAGTTSPVSRASELLPELREIFIFTLDTIVATQLNDQPELAAQAKAFASAARNAATLKALGELLDDIKRFAFRLEFVAEDRAELRGGILKLLQLMIENISELVVDDRWLNGQVGVIREIVARPMNLRTINELMLHESLGTTARYTPLGLDDLQRICTTAHPRG